MPFDDPSPLQLPPTARIEVSAAIELSWLVIGCGKRNAVHDMGPELEHAVDVFWDDGQRMFAELLVIAAQLDCLTGWNIDPLLNISEAELDPDADFDLATEPADEQIAIRRRIARLAADRELRVRYQELLRAVWADAEPLLRELGRSTVERAAQRARASVEHGQSPIELAPEKHISRREPYRQMTQRALREGTLVISPCYLAGGHGHIVALPGALSLCIGTGVSSDMARQRALAERVASELKLLSDPTRLLILTELDRIPATVGEIALRVGVAQPTASVHVRQLREAGLLAATRAGTSACYRVDRERLREALQSAHDALLPEGELVTMGS